MGAFQTMAKRILQDGGVELEVRAGLWYPMQAWIGAFVQISARIGEKTLFLIGTKIPETALLPPTIVDVPSALSAVDVGYHMNHRRDGAPMFDPETATMLEGIGHYALRE